MAAMPQAVQEAINKSKAVVFTTVNAEGQPNSCVVGIKKVIDDNTVYLSDQFFNKTYANLQESQKVAIAFWGEGYAYQLHGAARYVNEGAEFTELQAWATGLFEAMGLPFKPKGGAFVDVSAVYQMSAGPEAGVRLV